MYLRKLQDVAMIHPKLLHCFPAFQRLKWQKFLGFSNSVEYKNRHVYAQATQQVYNVQHTSANQYAYLIWFLKHIFLHMDRARTCFVVHYDNFSKKTMGKKLWYVASFWACRFFVAVQAACSRSSTRCGPNSSALCAKRQLFPCLKIETSLMARGHRYKRINEQMDTKGVMGKWPAIN